LEFFNIELFKDITYLSIQINQTNKAEIVRPIDYIYKLVSGLIFLFVEEVIETIISATYAFCLENRQVYLAMKYGKRCRFASVHNHHNLTTCMNCCSQSAVL